MVHVSQLSADRVENPSEVVNQGQRVWVKVIEIKDDEATGKQKISLSMRNVNQSNGVDLDPGNMDLSGGGAGGGYPRCSGGGARQGGAQGRVKSCLREGRQHQLCVLGETVRRIK
jgi:hypothetical protein